ncbi:MAG: hypothetical protein Unbinned5123contig1000_37 [Prokaryotic dsDNA virus sp.]|nr:MAG: hypothetical protein Unbinned5123contig1000_37 [Prokaryotic dsDNA virus sp.]
MRVNMVNQVKGFIIAKPKLADSDVDLIWAIWAWQLAALKPSVNIKTLSARNLMRLWKDGKISSPFNISRSRRKCQQHYPETRGENYARKQNHQETIKSDVKKAAREASRALATRSNEANSNIT